HHVMSFSILYFLFFFFFFFSSRRRHTRSKRDWSSDVCSSDLDDARGHVLVDEQIRTPGLPLCAHHRMDGAYVSRLQIGEAVRPIPDPLADLQCLQPRNAVAQLLRKPRIGTKAVGKTGSDRARVDMQRMQRGSQIG